MANWLTISLILVSVFAPLLVFVSVGLLAGLFGWHGVALKRLAVRSAVGAAAIAALCTWLLLFATIAGTRIQAGYTWAVVGNRTIEFSVRLDPLGATLAALVGTVTLAVTVFSLGYMGEEKRQARYFAYLGLFSGAMLLLVWSGSLLLLYLAWEGVGLASFLLIGFYWERPAAGPAASKAFLVTRIGDVGLLLAILALFFQTGSFDIATNLQAVTRGQIGGTSLTLIALLLFMGAAGKSAQVPFQVWLPDAMAGPTPVSALIHSATMVAAGVYLVARMLPLILASGVAAGVIVTIGLVSTLMASAAALAQPELKQVLAYSTISQLGEMLVGLGLGGLAAGTFHLVMQGLFKASLFLAAGVLAHALGTGGPFEFARYGGVGKYLPRTRFGFAVAALALAGVPVTLAPGSRDSILGLALAQQPLIAILLLVADLVTAAYITRAFLLTFTSVGTRFAASSNSNNQPPLLPRLEERPLLTTPLLALVLLLPIVGLAASPLFGAPFNNFITDNPNLPKPVENNAVLSFIFSLSAALIGIAATYLYYTHTNLPQSIKPTLLRRWVVSGFGFNWFYNRVLVTLIVGLMLLLNWFERTFLNRVADLMVGTVLNGARVFELFDSKAMDAGANQLTNLTLRLARRQNQFDAQVIDRTVAGVGHEIKLSSGLLARLQTGQVGNYLFAIFVWGLVALLVGLILGFLG